MMKNIISLLLLFSFCGKSSQGFSEQELVVRLETKNQLVPVSVAPFAQQLSTYSKEELEELEKVFRFDLNHNGIMVIAEHEKSPSDYHIEILVKEHKLSGKVSTPLEKEITFGPLHLTGYPGEDRRQIHLLSDTILEHLFGVKGVASSRILYTIKSTGEGKESSEIWESDYDGGNARQITRHCGYCVTPAYIPPSPGKIAGSFVYVSYQTGQPKIYAAPLNGGPGKLLLHLAGNQLMPVVSRQRDQIAFICDAMGNPDLFIQEFNPDSGHSGKPRLIYSVPYATQGTPSFSPDGTKIAFVSDKSGTPRIYVMKILPPETPLKEIQPVLISSFTKENTAPSWSPDGTKIAYCAKVDGVRQIMVFDYIAGVERQLTQGPGNKENPTWGPNSMHLIYNTSDTQACELYLINLKQGHARKLNLGQGEKRFPSWEPPSGTKDYGKGASD